MRATRARLHELLSYNSETGVVTWRVNRRGRYARAGLPAGRRRPDGYIRIGIDGELLYAHRVAWLLHIGDIEAGMEVDHIDHDHKNNRISNLRLVTQAENARNLSLSSRNTSGVIGVSWSMNARAWLAQVQVGDHRENLGYFKNLCEAKAARVSAQRRLGFHANHGVLAS